jgi:hypothetical protein
MRVTVLIKATEWSEAGEMPSQERLEEMTACNRELVKAGDYARRGGPSSQCERRARRVLRQRAQD